MSLEKTLVFSEKYMSFVKNYVAVELCKISFCFFFGPEFWPKRKKAWLGRVMPNDLVLWYSCFYMIIQKIKKPTCRLVEVNIFNSSFSIATTFIKSSLHAVNIVQRQTAGKNSRYFCRESRWLCNVEYSRIYSIVFLLFCFCCWLAGNNIITFYSPENCGP